MVSKAFLYAVATMPAFAKKLEIQAFQLEQSKISAADDARRNIAMQAVRNRYDEERNDLFAFGEPNEDNQAMLDKRFAHRFKKVMYGY